MASKDEERKKLQAQLDALDKDDDEPEFEYEIGRGDNYARVSSKSRAGKKINNFFKESFGIDLDDTPPPDAESDDEGDGKAKPKPKPAGRQQGGEVRAFGRRVS